MLNRSINTTALNHESLASSALGSLFALELFAPSRELYLVSPWLSDVPLLNNAFGQFRPLLPEQEMAQVRLSTLLNTLAQRGTQVCLLTRPDEQSQPFLRRLQTAVQCKCLPTLHEKLLVTNHFYWRGSMNFTYAGVHQNDEHSELSTEPTQIAQALLEARQRWESV